MYIWYEMCIRDRFTAATNPYITVKINENDKKEVLNIIDEALSDIECPQ